MYYLCHGSRLEVDALSGILGSISIACWMVVFTPQIGENFRRGSAEGLSVIFIGIWLIGDVFNILGSILQGVLPTMIILAVYYTFADGLLLAQIFWYEGFSFKDKVNKPLPQDHNTLPTEWSSLLRHGSVSSADDVVRPATVHDSDRRTSFGSFRERLLSVDATHLSKAMPLVPERTTDEQQRPVPLHSAVHAVAWNLAIIVLVIIAGVLGWWLGNRGAHNPNEKPERGGGTLEFNALGQVFGYICALLYLVSRVPQLLLNYRRKSTQGISMLFFIVACIGNFTYAMSILVYHPICKHPTHCGPGEIGSLYGKYVAVNASWLLGSVGSLALDLGVFVQYFMYKDQVEEIEDDDDFGVEEAHEATVVSRGSHNRRPVLD
jgi:uncharacterized protein with PQ loop repeat